MKIQASCLLLLLFCVCPLLPAATPAEENPALQGVHRIDLLPPGANNPRNSEGSFIQLRDGRLLFAYSRFLNGGDNDFGRAVIAGRYSSDGGKTWEAADVPLLANESAPNAMSVSFLRLHDGRIALFYGRKNSDADSHYYVRFSADEARTWSEAVLCTPGDDYHVMNNDRALQLESGRIVLPVALHSVAGGKFHLRGVATTYFSDDNGMHWSRSESALELPVADEMGLQEPGVVALKPGKLMMFARTMQGCQYISYSSDQGSTWSAVQRSSIIGPLGGASIKRIPSTGDLLLVWNDHTHIDASFRLGPKTWGKRTPVTVAISRDEGKTWTHAQNIFSDSTGWYSYFAIYFVGDRTLLAFCSTAGKQPALSNTDVVWFETRELYR